MNSIAIKLIDGPKNEMEIFVPRNRLDSVIRIPIEQEPVLKLGLRPDDPIDIKYYHYKYNHNKNGICYYYYIGMGI